MEDRGKTILILGNGFDLAHDLPTKYSHFLDFCQRVEQIWRFGVVNNRNSIYDFKRQWLDGWKIHESISLAIEDAFKSRQIKGNSSGSPKVISDKQELSEIFSLIDDNVWYIYFKDLYKTNCMKGENWIDFESEIRFVISAIDHQSPSLTNFLDDVIKEVMESIEDTKMNKFKNALKFDKFLQTKGWPADRKITVRDFREKAFEDLERLTRALELYLVTFVEKIPISKKISEISNLTPDYVINFNYTDTYERIYKKGKVYHIHGKADEKHSAKENDMVLGIDEYWSKDERDERTNFTIFKKFSQRIQKHTGNESYKYLEEMQKLFKKRGTHWSGNVDRAKDHPDGVSHVYVFGHSLDVTDKDILSSFIGDDSTSVIVYSRDKGTEGELIANVIKLIGERNLLDKSNHVPTKLDFVIQKQDNDPIRNN